MATRLVSLVCLGVLCALSVLAEGGPAYDCPAGMPIPEYGSCTGSHTGCCEAGLVCYKQDDQYAQCREPGSCPCSAWDCTELHEPCDNRLPEKGNCRQSGCCETGLVCYEQDSGYAQCLHPGSCPNCSSAWTCNIVRPGGIVSAQSASLLEGDQQASHAQGTRPRQSSGKRDIWKKIVGGVVAGVGTLALIAVLALYISRTRHAIPTALPPQTPIKGEFVKGEFVYMKGEDVIEAENVIKQRRTTTRDALSDPISI